MPKLGFAINLHRCIGCRTCTISCKMENGVADGVQRIRVLNSQEKTLYDVPTGDYPALALSWRPLPCQHCDVAPCIAVCNYGATSKREDGVVLIDKELCEGCQACIDACPYGARIFDSTAGKTDKCSYCIQRIDAGDKTTMCELCCPNRAITSGDLDDPASSISQVIAKYPVVRYKDDEGTAPNVYYYDSVRGG